MRTILSGVFGVLLIAAADSSAQTGPSHQSVPAVHSVKATAPIVVDGLLNDEAWLRAPAVTAFTQRDPEEGKPVSEATELRIAYDEAALYVAARMHDREPPGLRGSWRAAIRMPRPTASRSSSTLTTITSPAPRSRSAPPGVQRDATIYNDSWTDDSWDAVWESAVKIDETGWSAEMRIPSRSCGFRDPRQLTFGINAMRYIQRKKEEAWLVHVPKTESGLASRMGHLDGLDGVAPHRTVELMPYVVSRAEYVEPRGRRSVQRRRARVCRHRRRPEIPREQQPVARRDHQSRLRPGRSRSGGREPHGVRDLLRGEAAVLHRGREHLQQLRRGGANNFWGFNRAEPQHLLLAPHRPRAAGQRERRLRRAADGDDDPRRGEADRQDAGAAGASACSTR